MHTGKEVSVTMEYNRQVPVGGAASAAATAAAAKGASPDQRDMAFATVTVAESTTGEAKTSNVRVTAVPILHGGHL